VVVFLCLRFFFISVLLVFFSVHSFFTKRNGQQKIKNKNKNEQDFFFFFFCSFLVVLSLKRKVIKNQTVEQLEKIVTCFLKIHSIWWLSNLACFRRWSSPLIKGGGLLLVVRNFSRASLRCVISIGFFFFAFSPFF